MIALIQTLTRVKTESNLSRFSRHLIVVNGEVKYDPATFDMSLKRVI